MDIEQARTIIEALADGIEPESGEVMPPGSPYQTAAVVRALHVALDALRRRRNLPENAGKPWTEGQDAELRTGHGQGETVEQLARAQGRTRASIEARMVRLGLVPTRFAAQAQPKGVAA